MNTGTNKIADWEYWARAMTGSQKVWRKTSRRPLLYVWTVVFFLIMFSLGEFLLQNRLAYQTSAIISCLQSERQVALPLPTARKPSAKLTIVSSPTVFDIFNTEKIIYYNNLTVLASRGLHTRIEPSEGEDGFMQYGLAYIRDACLQPNGKLVIVGSTAEEIEQSVSNAGEVMATEWRDTYNCSFGCSGVQYSDDTPEGALWIPGNTTHIIPYLQNVFHHFSERVWPHLTGFQQLLPRGGGEGGSGSKAVPHANQYYVHRMHTWLEQAHHNLDRNTFMFQLGLLGQLTKPATKFLQHGESETRAICFERLTLTCATCGRVSPKLGLDVYGPAIDRYRQAAFAYFKIAEPEVSLPPHPLRVTLYGRSDASRRRVANIVDVAAHLRNWTQPPLVVTFFDELLASNHFNHTLPEVVSLMAQTDIFITPHGANTWAALFLPKGAAVIEVYGPCGPSTWLQAIVPALQLKHKTDENPWGERVASPLAGNTTQCESALHTPDFTFDIEKLDDVIHSLGLPNGPGDRLPFHWLYDWTSGSY